MVRILAIILLIVAAPKAWCWEVDSSADDNILDTLNLSQVREIQNALGYVASKTKQPNTSPLTANKTATTNQPKLDSTSAQPKSAPTFDVLTAQTAPNIASPEPAPKREKFPEGFGNPTVQFYKSPDRTSAVLGLSPNINSGGGSVPLLPEAQVQGLQRLISNLSTAPKKTNQSLSPSGQDGGISKVFFDLADNSKSDKAKSDAEAEDEAKDKEKNDENDEAKKAMDKILGPPPEEAQYARMKDFIAGNESELAAVEKERALPTLFTNKAVALFDKYGRGDQDPSDKKQAYASFVRRNRSDDEAQPIARKTTPTPSRHQGQPVIH